MKPLRTFFSISGALAVTALLIYASLRNTTSPEVESYRVRWSDTTNVATIVNQFDMTGADTSAQLDSNAHALFSYVFPYRPYLFYGMNIRGAQGGAVTCTVAVTVYATQKNSNGTMPPFGSRWDVVTTDTAFAETNDAGELFGVLVSNNAGVYEYALYKVERIAASDTLAVGIQNSGRND